MSQDSKGTVLREGVKDYKWSIGILFGYGERLEVQLKAVQMLGFFLTGTILMGQVDGPA